MYLRNWPLDSDAPNVGVRLRERTGGQWAWGAGTLAG